MDVPKGRPDAVTAVRQTSILSFVLMLSVILVLMAYAAANFSSESCIFYRILRKIACASLTTASLSLAIWAGLPKRASNLLKTHKVMLIFAFAASCYALINITLEQRIRMVSYRMLCGNNLAHLREAIWTYAKDNDGKFPSGRNWFEELEKTGKVTKQDLVCPESFWPVGGYAFNKNLSGLRIDDVPPGIVVLFEIECGCNIIGGPELLDADKHEQIGSNVLLSDSSVLFVRKQDAAKLRWEVASKQE